MKYRNTLKNIQKVKLLEKLNRNPFIKFEKKLFIGTSSVFLIGLFLFYLAWCFSSGSYAYAEFYKFDVSEKNLLK